MLSLWQITTHWFFSKIENFPWYVSPLRIRGLSRLRSPHSLQPGSMADMKERRGLWAPDESSSLNDHNSKNQTILSELLASCLFAISCDRISQPSAEASIAQCTRGVNKTIYCSATIFQVSFERAEPRWIALHAKCLLHAPTKPEKIIHHPSALLCLPVEVTWDYFWLCP